MTEVMKKRIDRWGLFLGATAYGFVHMPSIMVNNVKYLTKERDYEKHMKEFEKHLKFMVDAGHISDESAEKIWEEEKAATQRKIWG